MRTIAVSALKAALAEHLRDVKGGEQLIITERGVPIARVVPFARSTDDIARLVAAGVVTPGAGAVSDAFFDLPLADDPQGLVRSAIDQDRDETA